MMQEEAKSKDHLANERTYLAWIRTNLGLMAFGFVIERFSLFIDKLGHFFESSSSATTSGGLQQFSSAFGVVLVGIGALLCLFSFLKYKKTQKQINNNSYQSSNILDTLLAVIVFSIGIVLIFYLVTSRALI